MSFQDDALKITRAQIEAIELPLRRHMKSATHDARHVYCLLITLHTASGQFGEGYAFTWGKEQLQSVAEMAKSMVPRFVGRDPHEIEGIWASVLRDYNFYGQAGVDIIALCPLDVACWDLIGKAAGRPLYQLFGACRDEIPVYASGGLFIPNSIPQLQAEAQEFIEAGFKAMKIRLGGRPWKEDVARVAALREAIGPDIALMADANQSLSAIDGMRLVKGLEPYDLEWFEEPVVTWNDRASAAIRQASSTPLASGETEYTRYGIRRMVQNEAADIYMPDLQRMGGYSEMRKAVHFLAAHDLPVAPHLFSEHMIHIAASAHNATWCEITDWFEPMFNERLTLNERGNVTLPRRPGVGFTFDRQAIEKYSIALGL